MAEEALEIRFWGVRGSLPSPGNETALVGGNTSCVEVTGGGSRVILDAGSGIRALGDALMKAGEAKRVHLLLSHVHWDHVMGIPFFTPLYVPGTELVIGSGPLERDASPQRGALSASDNRLPLRDVLKRQMTPPLFPIEFDAVAGRVTTVDLEPDSAFTVGRLEITMASLSHPDPVWAYRISFGGHSVVYATDTEHQEGKIDERLVRLALGADVLIYDAQYTPEEYRGEVGQSKKGWGHSTFEAGAAVARAAGAKTLVLFHHDPRRTDEGVAEIVQRARAVFPNTVAARESLSLRFDAEPRRIDASPAA